MQHDPSNVIQLRKPALMAHPRTPAEFEIVAVNYHCANVNVDQGHFFEAISNAAPLNKWFVRFLEGSPLQHPQWADFSDPSATTHHSYSILQDAQEKYLEALFDRCNARNHDHGLPMPWIDTLARLHTPARYAFQALQRDSAYGASITPTRQIALCFALQAADCLRWLSHTSYRTAELAINRPEVGFKVNEHARWHAEPAWQGFRTLQEKCMSTFDWGEHFVALNLVTKPALEEAGLRQLGLAAHRAGDQLLALVIDAQLQDVARHRAWTLALTRFMLKAAHNRAHIERWIAKWAPEADRAIEAFCTGLPDSVATAAAAKMSVLAYRSQALG